jgi:hypothetical protein
MRVAAQAAFKRGASMGLHDPLERLSWSDLSAPTKVQILVSEHVHLGKLGVIEDWVRRPQVRALEEELARRGVIWDLNGDPTGSEHLYIESAALHVDTYFRANKAKLGALRLLQAQPLISLKCSACAEFGARRGKKCARS